MPPLWYYAKSLPFIPEATATRQEEFRDAFSGNRQETGRDADWMVETLQTASGCGAARGATGFTVMCIIIPASTRCWGSLAATERCSSAGDAAESWRSRLGISPSCPLERGIRAFHAARIFWWSEPTRHRERTMSAQGARTASAHSKQFRRLRGRAKIRFSGAEARC